MSVRTPLDEQPLVEGVATPWAEARQRLETPERDRTYWLATVGPDGRSPLSGGGLVEGFAAEP
jgi:hypothetical protein